MRPVSSAGDVVKNLPAACMLTGFSDDSLVVV